MSLERLTVMVQKRLRAHRLGLRLGRSQDFRLPETLRLHGKQIRLHLPEERGVWVAFAELLFVDCYGLEKVRHPVATVLDIGANVGLFAIAARNAFPNARIHCYEPNPHLEPYLKAQAEAVGASYYLEAVEREDGQVMLDVHAESVRTRSRIAGEGKIPALAFRKAVERIGGIVDLAKVDCEGAEWSLWEDTTAWQAVKSLTAEYHLLEGHTHEDAARAVTSLGFRVLEQFRAESLGLIRATRLA